MNIKLSILIMTVSSRFETFCPKLLREIERQCNGREDVEILCLYDNKKRTTGAKRNSMIQISKGEYITFIDDDDRIDEQYVQHIMDTLHNNPIADCVVFDCITHINGNYECLSKYGVEFEYGQKGDQWRGKPAHTMVWKSSIVRKHAYQDLKSGEDIEWVCRACVDIKNQVRIDKVLYYYDYNEKTTETRN